MPAITRTIMRSSILVKTKILFIAKEPFPVRVDTLKFTEEISIV